MLQLNIKPGDKLIKGYYEVLGSLGRHHVGHEMAVRSAFQDVLGYSKKLDAQPLLANHAELGKEVQGFRAAAERLSAVTDERDTLLRQLTEKEIAHAITNPHVAAYVHPEIQNGRLIVSVLDGNGGIRFHDGTTVRVSLADFLDELKEDATLRPTVV